MQCRRPRKDFYTTWNSSHGGWMTHDPPASLKNVFIGLIQKGRKNFTFLDFFLVTYFRQWLFSTGKKVKSILRNLQLHLKIHSISILFSYYIHTMEIYNNYG